MEQNEQNDILRNTLLRDIFSVDRNSRNVHTFNSFYSADLNKSLLICTDPHWDNPHCDRVFLKKHLEEAKAKNAGIVIFGDLFCLMQGRYDPRGTKKDVRPEHNTDKYFDSIIETAVEWWGPYANNLLLVTRGNHETSIQKRQETDILQRFVDMMNLIHKPKQAIQLGGYGGWIRFQFDREASNDKQTKKLKYYHGSGGGGIVTHGQITNQRRQNFIHGADLIVSGHVHEDLNTTFMSEHLNKDGNIELKETVHVIASTYKEEYSDGNGGWHIERGAPPKVLGGAWLDFYMDGKEIKFNVYRAK